MEIIDLNKLLANNPRVDCTQVQEVLLAVEELKRRGVSRASYNLVSPYRRSRPTEPRSHGEDSQLLKLKTSR